MVESDQSDMDSHDEMPDLEVSNASVDNEIRQKRLREESSEDEKLDLPSKKLCTAVDEDTSEKHNIENASDVNGVAEDEKQEKDLSIDVEKDKNKSVLDDSTNEMKDESHGEKSESKSEEEPISNDNAVQDEDESDSLADTKQKENISMEAEMSDSAKDATIKEEEEQEEDVKPRKKHRKSQIDDAEVVEGLELSVECASDNESSSSSHSEDKKDKKPVQKTIIVKAKPNDSELDVSSSEAEKSDSQEATEVKPKQTPRKGRKKGRTSFSKRKNTDSEENNDDISDEDYSPKTKKKLKKTAANKKAAKSSAESKRGRGRGRKSTAKPVVVKEDAEDENSNITEDTKMEDTKTEDTKTEDTKAEDVKTEEVKVEEAKTEETGSDVESVENKSEDENDSEDGSKNGKRRRNTKPDDDKRIQLLKKYIRMAGIHVKSYNELWINCKSNAARVRCLKDLLEKNGITGRPTVEKCKKAKERNERLKDVAELNTSNIISEGRITRAQRNKDSNKDSSKTPGTPTKHREARNTFKRVLNVIDSDSD